MEECFTFQSGGGFVFQMGGASFLSVGGYPMGGISFDGRRFQKKLLDRRGCPPCPPTMGNPEMCKWF